MQILGLQNRSINHQMNFVADSATEGSVLVEGKAPGFKYLGASAGEIRLIYRIFKELSCSTSFESTALQFPAPMALDLLQLKTHGSWCNYG